MPPYAKTIALRASRSFAPLMALCIAATLLVGCDKSAMPRYSRFVDFADARWMAVESVDFEFDSVASAALQSARTPMMICVRHGASYPYAELWIAVDMFADGAQFESDTLRMKLADADGVWLGRRSYGMFEVKAPLPAAAHRADRIELWHLMPTDQLESVRSIGIVAGGKDADSYRGEN